ncbi:MAG: LytTR family DNA-binding domain-containing protein [Myxococcaceae bacterium]|nr:LytTR family DNA-binding domain-containing protein [Myxococcaceae bacterium]
MLPDPKLRVLVLEDEWPARNFLVQLLEASGLAEVVAAVPSTSLATSALSSSPVPIDVAFVDVNLAGEPFEGGTASTGGLLWVDGLRTVPSAPQVVITTASKEHALKAFELGVVDYLLKPFTLDRVKATLARFKARVPPRSEPARRPARIAARKGKRIVFLEANEVWAFEAEGRLCFVHAAEGRLDVDLSLTSLEAVLGSAFLRVHRNWLVAVDEVRGILRDGGETTLSVGDAEPPLSVPVARDRAGQVRERLLDSAVGLRRDEGPA